LLACRGPEQKPSDAAERDSRKSSAAKSALDKLKSYIGSGEQGRKGENPASGIAVGFGSKPAPKD